MHKMESRLTNGLLVVCALVVTGFVAAKELRSVDAPITGGQLENYAEWRDYARDGRLIGPSTARVVLVEFSDFQCPYCRRMSERLRAIRAKFPNDFAVMYRHWPLTRLHPNARAAAVAAECAGRQDRFAAMHDVLFESSDSIGILTWEQLAGRAGVPSTSSFRLCLTDSTALSVVLRDSAEATRLGARGTPTSLINGVKIRGSIPEQVLERLVRDAIKAASK